MKLKIERPKFLKDFGTENPFINDRVCGKFVRWFDTQVAPINKILSEGAAVRGFPDGMWNEVDSTHMTATETVARQRFTHKALLIQIQPIEVDTAESVLRELVSYKYPVGSVQDDEKFNVLMTKAGQVLKESER